MEKFNCSHCSQCCRIAIPIEGFPFKHDESGACEKLNKETGQCTIYETRPDMCRVDKFYEQLKEKFTWEEYLKLTYKSCDFIRSIKD